MNERYRKQVALLIRMMPLIFRVKDFAIHGGTALNLFHRNMERYSVDIDITYIPLRGRRSSLNEINNHLSTLKCSIERAMPNINIVHKSEAGKLFCTNDGIVVKLEVNGIKRGILGETEQVALCEKAKNEFGVSCWANIVPWSQLYGGKIVAALSRQHPRDLFDCRNLTDADFYSVKNGFILNLLGSDKPIVECLNPNPINQKDALENQFYGMTDMPLGYVDYERAQRNLLQIVNKNLTPNDKRFLLSFEIGQPDWKDCCAGDLSRFPSVQWKVQNIRTLQQKNPGKYQAGIAKLQEYLGL